MRVMYFFHRTRTKKQQLDRHMEWNGDGERMEWEYGMDWDGCIFYAQCYQSIYI